MAADGGDLGGPGGRRPADRRAQIRSDALALRTVRTPPAPDEGRRLYRPALCGRREHRFQHPFLLIR